MPLSLRREILFRANRLPRLIPRLKQTKATRRKAISISRKLWRGWKLPRSVRNRVRTEDARRGRIEPEDLDRAVGGRA